MLPGRIASDLQYYQPQDNCQAVQPFADRIPTVGASPDLPQCDEQRVKRRILAVRSRPHRCRYDASAFRLRSWWHFCLIRRPLSWQYPQYPLRCQRFAPCRHRGLMRVHHNSVSCLQSLCLPIFVRTCISPWDRMQRTSAQGNSPPVSWPVQVPKFNI